LWSVLLNRCQGVPTYNVWGADATSVPQEGQLISGGKLILAQDGVVSAYDVATGTRLWQDTVVAPSHATGVTEFEATSSLVMVSFQASKGGGRLVFLDTADGHLLGQPGDLPPGDPFLVGSHVVIGNKDQVLGYDPATGRITWRQTVPDAPQTGGELADSSTVYLSSVQASGVNETMMQNHLLRIDAATGDRLPPLSLPRKVNVDPEMSGGNSYAQGLLLLSVVGTSSTAPGQAITDTMTTVTGAGRARSSA
jgi:outer membrane protein assembly factor BamB